MLDMTASSFEISRQARYDNVFFVMRTFIFAIETRKRMYVLHCTYESGDTVSFQNPWINSKKKSPLLNNHNNIVL